MDVCQWVEKSKIQLWRVVAFFFCNNVNRIAFAYSYPNFYLFIFSPELLCFRVGPERVANQGRP